MMEFKYYLGRYTYKPTFPSLIRFPTWGKIAFSWLVTLSDMSWDNCKVFTLSDISWDNCKVFGDQTFGMPGYIYNTFIVSKFNCATILFHFEYFPSSYYLISLKIKWIFNPFSTENLNIGIIDDNISGGNQPLRVNYGNFNLDHTMLKHHLYVFIKFLHLRVYKHTIHLALKYPHIIHAGQQWPEARQSRALILVGE
jgi:hypothetical protein